MYKSAVWCVCLWDLLPVLLAFPFLMISLTKLVKHYLCSQGFGGCSNVPEQTCWWPRVSHYLPPVSGICWQILMAPVTELNLKTWWEKNKKQKKKQENKGWITFSQDNWDTVFVVVVVVFYFMVFLLFFVLFSLFPLQQPPWLYIVKGLLFSNLRQISGHHLFL